jgi:integrative and conjugative element protein (TIGR02256 family)
VPKPIGRCYLPATVADAMVVEATVHAPRETGGVMLGVCSGGEMWVQEVIGPGPAATHEPHRFVPDAAYQQERISEAYEASGRRVDYLGDWHSHPGMSVYLSETDVRTLREIAHHAPARQPQPLMVVLGHGDPWRIGAWRLTRGQLSQRQRVSPLTLVVTIT